MFPSKNFFVRFLPIWSLMKTHVCHWCWYQDSGDISKLCSMLLRFGWRTAYLLHQDCLSLVFPCWAHFALGKQTPALQTLESFGVLSLIFLRGLTESHTVVHTSINCFKRDPHLQKRPIKHANRHALNNAEAASWVALSSISEQNTQQTHTIKRKKIEKKLLDKALEVPLTWSWWKLQRVALCVLF